MSGLIVKKKKKNDNVVIILPERKLLKYISAISLHVHFPCRARQDLQIPCQMFLKHRMMLLRQLALHRPTSNVSDVAVNYEYIAAFVTF